MSVPLIRAEKPPPVALRVIVSGALLLSWAVVPLLASIYPGLYFLGLALGNVGSTVPLALASYAALAILVALTGIARRETGLSLDFTAVFAGLELFIFTIIVMLLFPSLLLDRHPFLPASDRAMLPPLRPGEVARIWIAAPMNVYPLVIAAVITALRLVARARRWSRRRERWTLYTAFVALLALGALVVVVLLALGHPD